MKLNVIDKSDIETKNKTFIITKVYINRLCFYYCFKKSYFLSNLYDNNLFISSICHSVKNDGSRFIAIAPNTSRCFHYRACIVR